MTSPDAAAATILRALLAGQLSPALARSRWPTEPLSQSAAVTFLEYFEQGIDGRGTREPAIDRSIENLASLLDAGQPATWNEATESWHSEAGPVDEPRPAAEVLRRALGASQAGSRARLELDVARLELDFTAAAHQLQQLRASAFGLEHLEPDERALWDAELGRVPPGLAFRLLHRVETAGVLLWAVGQVPKLPARKPFTLQDLAPLLPRSEADAVREATLRPVPALLEARAAARTAAVANAASTTTDLVRANERFRALVWLFTPTSPSLGATRLL